MPLFKVQFIVVFVVFVLGIYVFAMYKGRSIVCIHPPLRQYPFLYVQFPHIACTVSLAITEATGLDPLPGAPDAARPEAADEVAKRRRRKVEVAVLAAAAAVHDGGLDGAAVVVRADAPAAGPLAVKEAVADGDDGVPAVVVVAAGAAAPG